MEIKLKNQETLVYYAADYMEEVREFLNGIEGRIVCFQIVPRVDSRMTDSYHSYEKQVFDVVVVVDKDGK